MVGFDDEEFSKLRGIHYRGLARVRLDALRFGHKLVQQQHRQLCPKNVCRIQKVFEKAGCLRLQKENFINAIIDDSSLDDAVAISRASREELTWLREGAELPLLNFRHVDCLSGLHRVEAAKNFLPDNDQWWVVRLFSKETPDPVLAKIIEYYSNEQKPSDGEIFRKIRLYHREKDSDSENQWWAYLANSKPRGLRQLLKNRRLATAFDDLIDMPGLWTTLQLGALQRLLGLKCEEEMIRYLYYIKRVWDRILTCGETALPYSVVDATTVEKLESLCPNASTSDKDHVSILMRERMIFSSVLDEGLRTALLANINNIPTLIPSLRTFFETLKYLEPLCDILKRLLGNKMRGTIRRSVLGCFFPPEKIRVQKSEGCYMEFKVSPERSQAADLAYAQLWAFCGRHFDGLTSFTPKKETSKDRPLTKGPNPALWQRLARFALDLGFHIPTAKELAAQDPVSQLAMDYLRKVNPLTADFSAQQIHAVINASSQATIQPDNAMDCSLTQVDVERRCGRPFELDLEEDRRILFLPSMYANSGSTGVNLRFVRRNLFTCIFGEFHFPDDNFHPSVVSGAPSDPAPRKRRRVDDRGPTYPEERIGELETKLASSARAFAALRTAKMKLEERFRSLERRHAELLARQGVTTENRREHAPALDVEMMGIALPEKEAQDHSAAENAATSDIGMKGSEVQETESQNDSRAPMSDTSTDRVLSDENSALIIRQGYREPRHDRSRSPRRERSRTNSPGRNRARGWRQRSRSPAQNKGQAIVLHQEVASEPTDTPLTDWESLISPNENLIVKLAASYRHRFRAIHRPDYEIFAVSHIDGNREIFGLSFPICHSVEPGTRQVEMLMAQFNPVNGEPLSYMHRRGQMLVNPSPQGIFQACQQFTTCLVGTKGMLGQYREGVVDEEL